MAFKDNVHKDLDVFLNLGDFAQTVVYIDGLGALKEVNAIFLTKSELVLESMAQAESSLPALLVKRADLPELKLGERFRVGGVDYSVVETEYEDELLVKVYLSKEKRPLF